MTIDLARLAAGELRLPLDASEPVAFAADELAGYLGRMFGRVPARRAVAGPPGPWLGLGATPDGAALDAGAEWALRPAADGAVVVAAEPRAIVAAVYALLEAAGCRWSPHGATEEHVPGPDTARRELSPAVCRPAFARRAWAADLGTWHYSVPERLAGRLPSDAAFVDWMAKTAGTGMLFIRHANDTRWNVPELVQLLRRRGLAVEGGGHALVELLPRPLFAAHPEYFPLGTDGRSDAGNVCVASREALALIAGRARAARDEMGSTDLHVWGLDLLGGGWCRCPACAPLTPSDQALTVCNAVADALGDRPVFHLAYHDTIRAPARVRPDARVWAEFAPRERCYGHALDDPACATNAVYRDALAEHVDRFEGRVDAFEYYGDAILFGGCAVPLAEVVVRDLAYYRAVGVRGVSCLVFGQYSLWAYGVNVEAFASATYLGSTPDAIRARHCGRRFGPGAAAMERYLTALEHAMAAVVTYGDVLLPPRDPSRAPDVRAAVAEAVAMAPALRAELAAARATRAPAALVDAEERLLDYTLTVLAAARDWLDASGATPPDAARIEDAVATLAGAMGSIRAVDPAITGTWGAHDLELTHWFYAAALRGHGG
jgi:hypothetical protein